MKSKSNSGNLGSAVGLNTGLLDMNGELSSESSLGNGIKIMVKGGERKVGVLPKSESKEAVFGNLKVSSRLNLKVTEFSSDEEGEINENLDTADSDDDGADDKKASKKSKKEKKEKKKAKKAKKEKKLEKKEKKAKKKEKLLKLAEEIKKEEKDKKEKEKKLANKFTEAHNKKIEELVSVIGRDSHGRPDNKGNMLGLKPEPVLMKQLSRSMSEKRAKTPPPDERLVVASTTPPSPGKP